MIRKELFHSAIVHFPIALLMFSYVFFVVWQITGNASFGHAAYWSLLAGAAGTFAAVISGFTAQNLAPHTEQAHEIMERFHQPLGLAVMSVSIALAVWALLSRWNFTKVTAAIFIAAFTVLTCMIAATGRYGGLMVYEHGMAVSSKEICSESARRRHGKEGRGAGADNDHSAERGEHNTGAPGGNGTAPDDTHNHAGHDMNHKR